MTDATKIEPIGWGQLGLLNGKTYLRENYNRCPYPPPSDVIRSLQLVPFYDQSALDAAVLAAVAERTSPCGHPASLVMCSAETGEPLYCELCDDKSGRRDAELRESELRAANVELRAKLAEHKAESERLRKDAERYRWLRLASGEEWQEIMRTDPDGCDAAIDASMERGK